MSSTKPETMSVVPSSLPPLKSISEPDESSESSLSLHSSGVQKYSVIKSVSAPEFMAPCKLHFSVVQKAKQLPMHRWTLHLLQYVNVLVALIFPVSGFFYLAHTLHLCLTCDLDGKCNLPNASESSVSSYSCKSSQ